MGGYFKTKEYGMGGFIEPALVRFFTQCLDELRADEKDVSQANLLEANETIRKLAEALRIEAKKTIPRGLFLDVRTGLENFLAAGKGIVKTDTLARIADLIGRINDALEQPADETPAAECPPDETQIHVCENCTYPWKPVRSQCPICGFPAGGERTAVTPDGCTFCGGPHWESQCRYNR